MTLVIVCVCSGGVLSSIGFIGGLGFFARYFIAVANIVKFLSFRVFLTHKVRAILLSLDEKKHKMVRFLKIGRAIFR